MAFPKGKSGNPSGGRKEKLCYEALMLSLKREPANDPNAKTALQAIANKLVILAEDGDMQAIKYIMDRIDGAPTQEVHNTHEQVNDFTDLSLSEIASQVAGAIASLGGDAERVGVEVGSQNETSGIRSLN
jgi:hypothetical protein